jgi:hypothetical protein
MTRDQVLELAAAKITPILIHRRDTMRRLMEDDEVSPADVASVLARQHAIDDHFLQRTIASLRRDLSAGERVTHDES